MMIIIARHQQKLSVVIAVEVVVKKMKSQVHLQQVNISSFAGCFCLHMYVSMFVCFAFLTLKSLSKL